MSPTRRSLLSGTTAIAVGLAGCLDSGGADDDSIETLEVEGSSGDPVPVLPDGQVVLLDFWATWCAPCKPQMEELREIRERFPGVHMLSITNESDEAAVKSFWREYDSTWSVAMDPEVRTNERFDVTRIPTLLVFDPDGEEVWRHSGLAAADSIASALGEAGA